MQVTVSQINQSYRKHWKLVSSEEAWMQMLPMPPNSQKYYLKKLSSIGQRKQPVSLAVPGDLGYFGKCPQNNNHICEYNDTLMLLMSSQSQTNFSTFATVAQYEQNVMQGICICISNSIVQHFYSAFKLYAKLCGHRSQEKVIPFIENYQCVISGYQSEFLITSETIESL